MKRVRVALLCLLVALGCQPLALWAQTLDAANAFVTRWQGKADKPIKVPLYGKYAYRWEKANGTLVKAGVATVADGKLLELDVPADGAYVLKAGPAGVRRIEFGVWSGDWYEGIRGTPKALLQVVQWGNVAWVGFWGAFCGCENMNVAEGAGTPDLSGVASMHSAFWDCKSFNSPIGDWDVSGVRDVRGMFRGCSAFNQPLEKWDVSKVTDMERMFSGCSSFNQPLEKWDVSRVTNMKGMFASCGAFNQPLEKWDVSKVTSMGGMYMGGMFEGCGSFNQPLEKWDVSKVTSMGGMFEGCTSFNQPLEKWDVSQVTSMREMFKECSSFNQPLEKWDVSRVTSMEGMFEGCTSFNQPLEKWDVSKVENLGGMFGGCSTFNQPLEKWDVSLVTYMWNMFSGCSAFNQPLGGWTLASLSSSISFGEAKLSVANYSSTLEAWAAKRDQLLGGVRVSAHGLFFDAAGAAARQQLINGKGWAFEGDRETVPVPPLDAANAFITRWQGQAGEMIRVPLYGQYSYEWVRVAGGAVVASGEVRVGETRLLELAVPADGEYVLRAGPAGVKRIGFGVLYWGSSRGTPGALKEVSQWGRVAWESFAGAFYGCGNMNVAEGAGRPDLSGVTSMKSAFGGCTSFNSPIGDWDMSKVEDMEDMFKGCGSFNQPLGGWLLASLDGRIDFGDTRLSVANYSSTLEAWAAKRDQLKYGVRVGAKGLGYSAESKKARQQLMKDKGWQFDGDREMVDPASAFITRWQCEAGEDIKVPLYGSYTYCWEKADGTEVKAGVATVDEEKLLELPVAEAGEYVLKAGPAGVKRIEFGVRYGGSSRGTPMALLWVEKWGRVAWESFARAFYGCGNMNVAEGAGRPDLSRVTSMKSAFGGCTSFNSPIGDWDVSKVEDMEDMFKGCGSFNQPLGGWLLASFDGRIDFGDTRLSVANYSSTLEAWAAKRDQLKYGVRVGSKGLEYNAAGKAARRQLMDDKGWKFDGDISALDPSNAFVTRWRGEAGKPIQVPLYGHYSYRWEKADGTEVKRGVATMADGGLLELPVAEAGEYVLKAGPAGVKRIAFGMAQNASMALLQVSQWGSVAWESFARAFYGCGNMNVAEGAGKPDLSGVGSMSSAFGGCTSFNQSIDDWDVSKVKNMREMFSGCSAFDQPLGGWTLSALEYGLGLGGSGLSAENYSATLEAWAAKRDQQQARVWVDAEGLFYNVAGGAARELLQKEKGWIFQNDLPEFDASNTFMTRWQGEAGKPIQVPLYGHYSYRWEKADGTEVKAGVATVDEGKLLELPVAEDGEYVLKAGPAGVKRIEFGKRVERGWSYIYDYDGSRGAPCALREVSQWGRVAWESFAGAFYGCGNMNVAEGAGRPDLSRVTSMKSAFGGCTSFNSPIGDWDVSKVTDMRGMFEGCTSFNQPLGGWLLASLDERRIDFGDTRLSVANYSSTLEAWSAKRDQLQREVMVDAKGLEYNAEGKEARQQLMDDKGWKFDGDISALDPSNAFVTRWRGEAGKPIQVPLYGHYSYRWEKADGTEVKAGVATVDEGELLELPVAEAGEYVLKAGPAGVRRIEFGKLEKIGQRDIGGWHYTYVYDGSRGTPRALLRVEQWGRVAWESFAGAFYGCENMNVAEGAGRPDLSGVTSMNAAFKGCYKFNAPIGDWDVSRVEDMQDMFRGCVSFNQPLERWDVSRVTSMRGMFDGCSLFDQPLGGWTLSVLAHGKEGYPDLGLKSSGLSVENYSSTLVAWAGKMDQLQHGVRVNAQNLLFNEAGKAARQQLIDRKGWVFEGDRETVPVPPLDAANAFITRWQGKAGERIGVPLYGEYSYEWVRVADGSVVASGAAYVGEASLLGLAVPADGEYVLKAGPEGVKRIEFGKREERGWYQSYYYYVGSRGAPEALLQVSQWGSVAWESLAGAFYGCENMRIAEGAGRPDLSGVTSMQSAFEGCKSFNSPIGAWDVSGVTDMRAMFSGCGSFNQPLEGWDVSRVTDMEEMFRGCSTFNQPLEGWDVSRVTEMGGMFNGCSAFNQPLGAWDVSSVKDMGGMFNGCSTFNQPLEGWAVSRVTNMGGMFSGCSAFNQPLGGWRVLQVTSMRAMFSGCSSFNQPLAQWDVSQVENMEEMLSGCVSFNQPLDGWTLSALEHRDLGLGGCGLSVGNYSSMLTAWVAKSDRLRWGVRVKAEGLRCNAAGAAARQQLMDRMYWKFEGDGEATVDSPAVDIVDAPGWLTVGERHAFTAKVEPAAAPQAVVWSVDGAGAEFTGNELKVTKMGIITVTATALADPKPSRSVRIGVMAMPARLAILDAPTRLYVDRPHTFRAKVEPAGALQEVTWSVAEGEAWGSFTGSVLTAKQSGTITVTATAVANPKLSQSVRIEVAAYVPLSGLAVSPTSARLEIGGTQMLTVRYTPSDATNRAVTWSSSDKRVATVDAEGKVTGVAVGSATITAMSADGGCMATCAVTVNSSDTPPPSPSVAESVQLAGVSVSPNPFGDYLIVRGAAGVQRYALVRASGAVVLEGAHTGGDELGLSTSHLPAGIYWLRLVASDGERVLGVVRW